MGTTTAPSHHPDWLRAVDPVPAPQRHGQVHPRLLLHQGVPRRPGRGRVQREERLLRRGRAAARQLQGRAGGQRGHGLLPAPRLGCHCTVSDYLSGGINMEASVTGGDKDSNVEICVLYVTVLTWTMDASY